MHYPIVISDGETNGTPGMKYSLVSREVIADSIEVNCAPLPRYKIVTSCRSCTKATSPTQSSPSEAATNRRVPSAPLHYHRFPVLNFSVAGAGRPDAPRASQPRRPHALRRRCAPRTHRWPARSRRRQRDGRCRRSGAVLLFFSATCVCHFMRVLTFSCQALAP